MSARAEARPGVATGDLGDRVIAEQGGHHIAIMKTATFPSLRFEAELREVAESEVMISRLAGFTRKRLPNRASRGGVAAAVGARHQRTAGHYCTEPVQIYRSDRRQPAPTGLPFPLCFEVESRGSRRSASPRAGRVVS